MAFEHQIEHNRDRYLQALQSSFYANADPALLSSGTPTDVDASSGDCFSGINPGEYATGDEFVASFLGHLHGILGAAGLLELPEKGAK